MGLPSKTDNGRDRQRDEVELDLGRYELRRGGRSVKLEKKGMELLIFLAGRREQLVSRKDIECRLWQTSSLIDAERNINNLVRKIRRALGDDAVKPRFLETVIGKGYRFVGPMRVIGPLYSTKSLEEAKGVPPVMVPDEAWRAERPALAVLPLRVSGGAGHDKELSLAFADALTARLGNMEDVDVLPASAMADVPAGASAQETALRLGIRFALQGAVQISKAEARLSVELLDGHTQASCFSSKFSFDAKHAFAHIDEIAAQTARALKRPLRPPGPEARPRYSRDPLAYAEFIQGYQRSSSGDEKLLIEAVQHLTHALTRDPDFALAHAILAMVSATRYYEFDPTHVWLDNAEFHCQRALDLDPNLPEAHVANAFLLWGPARNFQHVEAMAELKRALGLQKNLPHAYNRLGTILAHIGLLDHARTMYERGRPFQPGKKVSHSIVQAYIWSGEYELAREEVEKWRAETPDNKYALYFAPQAAMLCGDLEQAAELLDDAICHMPQEPLLLSMEGLLSALTGKYAEALECVSRACEFPRTFGHAHHTYYQIACIHSLIGSRDRAFQWLERSVDTGFACWPFFRRDPCLKKLRSDPRFELLVSSLQAKYPDHLGLL